MVRLKPDTTTDVRLKPDTTTDVRLKPDTTTDVRLKPDTTSAWATSHRAARELVADFMTNGKSGGARRCRRQPLAVAA
jgi:hypothetical protein